MAIGYVKDSLGLAESTYLSDGLRRKRGFIHAKLLEGEIRDIACIYPVGRFWEMLTSFVPNSKMQKIKKKKEIFSFLYPMEVINKLTKDKRENELSGTWQRVFNGLETGTAGTFARHQKDILDTMMNLERKHYSKVFGEKSEIFNQDERKIIKESILECYFSGRQFFLDDKNKCRVTPGGYLDVLSELQMGKTVTGVKLWQIHNYKVGNVVPEIVENMHITIELLYEIQFGAMKKENVYYFEEREKNRNYNSLHVIWIKEDEKIEDAIQFGQELANEKGWMKGSDYNLQDSNSFYGKRYQELDKINPEQAMISLIMTICSQQLALDYIDRIFSWDYYFEHITNGERIKRAFYLDDYETVKKLLKEIKEYWKENENRYIYYILGKYQEEGILDDSFSGERTAGDCYRKCLKNIHNLEAQANKQFLGAAAYELVREAVDRKNYVQITQYLELAKSAEYQEIYDLEGDLYVSGEFEGYPQDYDKAIKCYAKSDRLSSKNKMYKCAKRYCTELRKAGKEDKAEEIYQEVSELAINEAVEEALIDFYIEDERKNVIEKDRKNRQEYLEQEHIFVVLGYGDATIAFLDSIKTYVNKEVYLLVWNPTLDLQKKIKHKYDFVNMEYQQIDEVLKKIDIYDMPYVEQQSFSSRSFEKKVLFVGLSERKTDNIAFAMDAMQFTWRKKLEYERKGNIWCDFEDSVEIVIEGTQVNTQMYLDTMEKSFGNNFYIPLHVIDYADEISCQLLVENPLFVPLLNPDSKADLCNIVILGNDDIIVQLIKNILSVAWIYHGKSNVKERVMETEVKNSISIAVLDKEAKSIEDKLYYDCPGLWDVEDMRLSFINVDVKGSEFVRLFISDRERGERGNSEAGKFIQNANYIICAMPQDAENLELGVRIRELLQGNRFLGSKSVEIAALCKHPIYSKDWNCFLKKEGVLKKNNVIDYNIHVFGEYGHCYSYDNLVHNVMRKIALGIHKSYYGNHYLGEYEAFCAYYSKQYNRDSSKMEAIGILYRCFSAGLFDDIVNWDRSSFFEEFQDYLEQYRMYILVPENTEKLAIVEHCRWCNYMISRGWKRASQQDMRSYLKKGNISHQFHLAKLHPFLVSWSELGDRGQELRHEKSTDRKECDLKKAICAFLKIYNKYIRKRLLHEELEDSITVEDMVEIFERYKPNSLEQEKLIQFDLAGITAEERELAAKICRRLFEVDYVLYEIGKFSLNLYELPQGRQLEGGNWSAILNKLNKRYQKQLEQLKNLEIDLKKLDYGSVNFESNLLEDILLPYLYLTKSKNEMREAVDVLLEKLKKRINSDNEAMQATGIQKWVDQCMREFQLKQPHLSIRENNRRTIETDVLAMEESIKKY